MIPLQRPVPELPYSRPRPLADEAPTVTVTATLPLRLTPPVTLPPPADETRVPVTMKGKLFELQPPASVENITFQVPSKAPAAGAILTRASTACGAPAVAATIAVRKAHLSALARLKLAKRLVDRAGMVIFFLF
jgi:hypothetical protein